jgi:hypothetical protein
MRGEMANQRWLQRLAGILAGQVASKVASVHSPPETTEQLLPKDDAASGGRLGAAGGYASADPRSAHAAAQRSRRPLARRGRQRRRQSAGACRGKRVEIGLQPLAGQPFPRAASAGGRLKWPPAGQQCCLQDIAALRGTVPSSSGSSTACGGQLPQGSIEVAGVHRPCRNSSRQRASSSQGRAPVRRRFTEGVGEGQVLQGVQGVVMDEIAQRRLRRQEVGNVLQAGLQCCTESRRGGNCCHFRRRWRTHSDSKMSGQPGQRRGHQAQQRCRDRNRCRQCPRSTARPPRTPSA